MAWKPKMVYVLTAFFKNFEESGYTDPSEEFFADTWEEAERKKAKLLKDDEYEDVLISDEMQEREFWEPDKLDELMRRAAKIASSQRSQHQKDVELAGLMTEMEDEFQIPILKNESWEKKHPEIFKTYKKISDMRTL